MSNWERRPLRQSQQHYGSLDAYILIEIVKAIMEEAKKNGQKEFKSFVKTLNNKEMMVSADFESDDDFETQ